MAEHPLVRLLRRAVGVASLASEERFGRGEQGPSPAIFPSVTVVGIDEIFRHDISAHLQAGEVGVEAAPHLRPCEATCRPQLAGDEASFGPRDVEDAFFDASFLGSGADASAVVAEVGPPLAADEGRLVLEELAVGASALLKDGALPRPEGPFPSAVGQAGVLAVFIRHFFGRPAFDAHAEQGQEAYLVDVVCQLGAGMQEFCFHFSVSMKLWVRKSLQDNSFGGHSSSSGLIIYWRFRVSYVFPFSLSLHCNKKQERDESFAD